MAEVRDGGFFSRAKVILPSGQVPTVEALEAALRKHFGDRYEIYRTHLIGSDLVAKRSGWSGIALKVKKDCVVFGPLAPSAGVRFFLMGLIPMVILWNKSWKHMLREFCEWFRADGLTKA